MRVRTLPEVMVFVRGAENHDDANRLEEVRAGLAVTTGTTCYRTPMPSWWLWPILLGPRFSVGRLCATSYLLR